MKEERISELEDSAIEITQSGKQKLDPPKSESEQSYRDPVETVSDFNLGGSKITVDGDCSHEIKRCLLLGRKVLTNLDSIFKSRDITLPTKVGLVKAMVFPVVIWM